MFKMESIPYISESRVRQMLTWERTFDAMECAMKSVSKNRAFQSKRSVVKLADTSNLMFVMPGYLADDKYGALGCKLFTLFPNNPQRDQPALKANIYLMDEETGDLKAVMAAADITEWRTAAASAVATKYLHGEDNNVLAVLGAGSLGRAHAIAFNHFFGFREVRIWNRTPERAKNVVNELNQQDGAKRIFVAYDNVEECVKGADVIVTATAGDEMLVKFDWLQKGVHINAVRVNPINRELDNETYKSSSVYIDYWEGADHELGGLKKLGVEFKGQIGDVIAGLVPLPDSEAITVFQSLGMAVEDCAMARMVYDLHVGNSM